MRMLLVAVAVIALASVTQARVWTTIYRCDETTPLGTVDPNQPSVYRDIMVGTRLTIVISSDTARYWWGSLESSMEDTMYFSLSGRRDDVNEPGYSRSCLAAAGEDADAWGFEDVGVSGLEFATGKEPVPGDWFIFDYRAELVGSYSLSLYDLGASLDVPIESLSLNHAPSRDFDGNATVDFADFALLASYWRTAMNPDPNSAEIRYDLNSDGLVDLHDLTLFSEYWLERTDCNKPASDPNQPLDP